MREILFRGKTTSKENGEFNNIWVYGDLIKNKDKYYIHPQANAITVSGELGKIIVMHEVIPETVGQWSGLLDKNGKKIFEGDILDTPRWIVSYCANTNAGLGMNAGWYVQRDNFTSWLELENTEWHVILGNIHDNPELLKSST